MTVEGVDYLFDRYAFLGVGRQTLPGSIAKTLRLKQKETLVARPALRPEAFAALKRLEEKTNACSLLLDEYARERFDYMLNLFENESPERISRTGDPAAESYGIALEFLFQPFEEKDLRALALAQSGFSQRRLDLANRMLLEDRSDDSIGAVRIELMRKALFYLELSRLAWQRMGMEKEFSEGRIEYIDTIAVLLPMLLRRRLLSADIGMSSNVFGRIHRGEDSAYDSLITGAIKVFMDLQEIINKNLKELKQVRQKLLDVLDIEIYGNGRPSMVWMAQKKNGSEVYVSDVYTVGAEGLTQLYGFAPSSLENLLDRMQSTVLIVYHCEIFDGYELELKEVENMLKG